MKRRLSKISESMLQYIRRKQTNKPSVKQNPSVSFKGTGEALGKQHDDYILLNIFVLHIYRTINSIQHRARPQ